MEKEYKLNTTDSQFKQFETRNSLDWEKIKKIIDEKINADVIHGQLHLIYDCDAYGNESRLRGIAFDDDMKNAMKKEAAKNVSGYKLVRVHKGDVDKLTIFNYQNP